MMFVPTIFDDEPMGDNYEYGYFPDNPDAGQMVFEEGVNGGFA